MTIDYRIGDTREVIATIPDNSGDAFVSEPSVRLMYRVLMIKALPR